VRCAPASATWRRRRLGRPGRIAMVSMLSSFAAASSVIALAACASGPDYQPQTVSAKEGAPFLMVLGPVVASTAAPVHDWWRLYDDPVLDGLVQDALAANTDVRVALARLQRPG